MPNGSILNGSIFLRASFARGSSKWQRRTMTLPTFLRSEYSSAVRELGEVQLVTVEEDYWADVSQHPESGFKLRAMVSR